MVIIMNTNYKLTFEDVQKQDLCMAIDGDVYDANCLEDAFQVIAETLYASNNHVSYIEAYQRTLERLREIRVFKKVYFSFPAQSIINYIQDYLNNEWSNETVDVELHVTIDAQNHLDKFLEELQTNNKVWQMGEAVGHTDISTQFIQFIKED